MTSDGQGRLDSDEVDRLFHEHGLSLRRFLTALLRDGHQAEEALQRTFQQTILFGQGVSIDSQRAWLFRVGYNEAMAIRRRENLDERSLRKLAATAPRYGLPADTRLVRDEEIRRVQEALKALPPDQQVVVTMRTYEQKTFQQIAKELQIPLGTVLTRMRLGLKKLHTALKDLP